MRYCLNHDFHKIFLIAKIFSAHGYIALDNKIFFV
jgi:hypothetical protein